MNIPDGWLAAIGAAFVAAAGVLGKFVQKHLDRYIAGLRADLTELKEKQDKCEATTLSLTERVAGLEAERDGFLAGAEHASNALREGLADDIVRRLQENEVL